MAQALGFAERQMVKTLLFATGQGEHVMVLLPADRSAVSGHLKKAIGSRNIRLAPLDTVHDITGYEVGSIPPFHWQPPGFRSFIEASLMEEEVLGVGAGVWGHEILIRPRHLVQAAQAVVVNLTDRSRPVFLDAASDEQRS
ncbi:MAG: aminoacyl-tRNA deacylase [Rhodothermales bacterium]